ncbi:FxSxx-COOH system tetratricopeptide repeat protein [Nonomuraea sp. NPDC048882]|uniref:FxSxx-COOH system tetratricopeptide repeat protein n=1 Tax=Nonomuraea sp. NPDC048882 TaxID=3154347 RepID=UPI0033D6053B
MPPIWGRKIPGRNRHFTGRETLLNGLRKSLTETNTAAVVPLPQALQGLGGVGKTQLAIEYAWAYRGYYDLVWWVAADQPLLIPSALAGLTEDLKLPSAGSMGIEEAADSVRDALQRGDPVDRWLLIFDNADDPEEIRPFIPQGSQDGHVLITSRNSRWSGVAETVSVDVFSTNESVAFLRKRLRRDVPENEAVHLAHELGNLPLALEQAAAVQDTTGMSTDEYVGLLAEQTGDLLQLGKSTEYPHTMTAAWQLSVHQVESRMPEAAEVLRCLAFFGPDPIPRFVFQRSRDSGAERMGTVLSNPLTRSQAFAELARFSLLRVEPDTGTVQVHRLVQALLRDSLTPEEQEEFRHEVHLLLAAGAPPDPEDISTQEEYTFLLPHVRPSGLTRSDDERVRESALNFVRHLYRVANWRSARSLAEEFRQSWVAASGEHDPFVLRLRRHLGTVLWQLSANKESLELNDATFDLMREVFGADHEETLRMALTYAANLRAQGRFEDAKEQDAASLAALEARYGVSDPTTLSAMNNLALDHALLSRYDTALELQKLAYIEQSSVRRKVNKWEVQLFWNNLARVVRLSGHHEQACDVGEEAYAYGVRELKIEHPLTLATARDLSIAKRRMGHLDDANELIQDVHTRLNKLYGPDSPETMAATVALSNTLRQLNRLEESMALAKDAHQRHLQTYGANHPFTYGCQLNLALLYRLRGDAKKAMELDEKTYEGLLDRLGAAHVYTFSSTINLAGDLAELGEPERAAELGRATLTGVRDFVGPKNGLSLSAAVNLSIDLRAIGRIDEATELYDRTMAAYETTLSPTHPERLHAADGKRFNWDFDSYSL